VLISKSTSCVQCGDDHLNQCFCVYTNGAYCFSCGYSTFNSKVSYSFKEKIEQFNSLYIPSNLVTNQKEFSLETNKWLTKYGIYSNLIKKYKIMYCPYDEFVTNSGIEFKGESLIFPVIENGNIHGYQRRFFPNKSYLSVGNINVAFVASNNNQTNNTTIILVEDFISCIRVGDVEDCLCLFGTKLKQEYIDSILRYENIIIWLDGDKPGQEAAAKIFQKLYDIIKHRCKLNAYNSKSYNLKIITTEKDPKEYVSTELKHYINDDGANEKTITI